MANINNSNEQLIMAMYGTKDIKTLGNKQRAIIKAIIKDTKYNKQNARLTRQT